MSDIKLKEVKNHSEAKNKGDYWFTNDGICFLCPFCGQINHANNHSIISRNPLTLYPSLVEHVGHKDHFWIVDGKIK